MCAERSERPPRAGGPAADASKGDATTRLIECCDRMVTALEDAMAPDYYIAATFDNLRRAVDEFDRDIARRGNDPKLSVAARPRLFLDGWGLPHGQEPPGAFGHLSQGFASDARSP